MFVDVVWYFLNDVYPSLYNGHRPLDPPSWWRRMFEGRPQEEQQQAHTNAEPIHRDIAAAAAAPELR